MRAMRWPEGEAQVSQCCRHVNRKPAAGAYGASTTRVARPGCAMMHAVQFRGTLMITTHESTFDSLPLRRLRSDLALALRAADYHGLSEGVCNHFSIALGDGSERFLINPRGLQWSEIRGDDIVMVDPEGHRLAGRHEVEPTAMFIHAAVHRLARKVCVLHTHMPHASALTLTEARSLDTCLSQ